MLTAWQKGDLVKIFGLTIRLTSHRYEKLDNGLVMNFNVVDTHVSGFIPYTQLIERAKLLETITGRKND